MVLTDALLEQPRMSNSLVVSWPLITILGTKLTWVQNSGFSVTSSCGTLTLLGMLVMAASALLTLLKVDLRSRRSSGSLDFVIYVHKKDCTTNSEMRLEKYQGRPGPPCEGFLFPVILVIPDKAHIFPKTQFRF
jgi:hypothetical protein